MREKYYRRASGRNVMRCLPQKEECGRLFLFKHLQMAKLFANRDPEINNSLKAARISEIWDAVEKLKTISACKERQA